MNRLTIIDTHDGSHSLLNEALNETYHSTHGAIQESLHVFITNGLHHWLHKSHKNEISILEIGFGTGLNALLTLRESIDQKIKVCYTSVEAFPIPMEVVTQLNYPEQIVLPGSQNWFEQMHVAEWDASTAITSDFILEKRRGKIQETTFDERAYDLIFFDAFAPAKQPEMWGMEILEKVISTLRPAGTFVTYCAQGQLKRNLKSLGMQVESLPGPPGKREMTRAQLIL